MQKENYLHQGKWWNLVFSLIASLIVAADQLSKAWIRTSLDIGQSIPAVGFPRLVHANNTGAAFGLFQGQTLSLIIVALVGVVAILVYTIFIQRRFFLLCKWLGWISIGLVLGGTIGNLIDRLRFGYVTDFIDFGFWPAFNVADSALTVGIILLAFSLLRWAQLEKHRDE